MMPLELARLNVRVALLTQRTRTSTAQAFKLIEAKLDEQAKHTAYWQDAEEKLAAAHLRIDDLLTFVADLEAENERQGRVLLEIKALAALYAHVHESNRRD